MVRQPAVAGRFYSASPRELAADIDAYLKAAPSPRPAIAAVSPHAGYVFSGPTAGKVLGGIEIPRKVVVAGPNHQGIGSPAALMSAGKWQTPLGLVDLDADLGKSLLGQCPIVEENPQAHQFEHSLEVQVPFLQQLRPDMLLTPLCLGWLSYEQCAKIGSGLARAIKAAGEPVLMVASTDMTHYESAESAREKDQMALERILALDPKGLYDTVRGQGITMCGVLPTTVCLAAALELGASKAELVEYTHSGEITGDNAQVVGYAGLTVS